MDGEEKEKQEKKHTKWVKSVMGIVAIGEAVVIFIGIQFIPYGRGYNNPPVKAEPQWNSPRTRELFFRACGDCHSNEVVWPWYGYIAPGSWLIQNDIDKGRTALNVSEWGREENDGGGAAETIKNGSMPPRLYSLFRSSTLPDSEQQELIRGLVDTFGEQKSDQKSKKKADGSIHFFPVRKDDQGTDK